MSTTTLRRPSSRAPTLGDPLTDLDAQLLGLVSRLRVVTQTQLERLFDDVPPRTLRYRVRRLHGLKLLGRTRPYRDVGSAPHHLWPTNRGDAVARGKAPPRRGERRTPNPLFLAHAAALSELYVVLSTEAAAAGLRLIEFRREGEARVRFTDAGGRERAIAPDVGIALRDVQERLLIGHVELDLGTMSHARLRTKLDGYVEHARSGVHRGPLPPLLFVTTSEPRADAFRAAAGRQLVAIADAGSRVELEVVVCPLAHDLAELPTARCWRRPGETVSRTLAEVTRVER